MNYKFLKILYILIILMFSNLFFLKKIFAEENSLEDLGPLNEQSKSLLNDFKESINNLSEASNTEAKNVDILLEDFMEHIEFINKKLNNNENEISAYALDFLMSTISEVSENLTTETELDLSNVDFDNLSEEQEEIMKIILKDLSIKKVNKMKNTINYAIQLKKHNLDSVNVINKINEMSLGFKELKNSVTGINLDFATTLNIHQLEDALQSLEDLDFEKITEDIGDSIKESTELIEEVIEQVAQAIAQTASEVMNEINSALGTDLNIETYAWLWGVEGVSSNTSFTDAVEIFNEAWGTEFSEDEVEGLMAYDTCWLYGLCD